MKKWTKKELSAAGIHNGHEIAARGPEPQVFIDYTPEQGRLGGGQVWRVYRVGYKTAPEEPWYNYGNKTFMVFRVTKGEALEAAKAWVAERYGIQEWERSPFGSWHPMGTLDELRKQEQAASRRLATKFKARACRTTRPRPRTTPVCTPLMDGGPRSRSAREPAPRSTGRRAPRSRRGP